MIYLSWFWQHSSNVIAHQLICTQRSSLTGGSWRKDGSEKSPHPPLELAKTATLNRPIIHPVSGLTAYLSTILSFYFVQVRKLQDKVSKCQEAVKKSKENYELALLDITNYNSRFGALWKAFLPRCCYENENWSQILLICWSSYCENALRKQLLQTPMQYTSYF